MLIKCAEYDRCMEILKEEANKGTNVNVFMTKDQVNDNLIITILAMTSKDNYLINGEISIEDKDTYNKIIDDLDTFGYSEVEEIDVGCPQICIK